MEPALPDRSLPDERLTRFCLIADELVKSEVAFGGAGALLERPGKRRPVEGGDRPARGRLRGYIAKQRRLVAERSQVG